MTKLYRSLFCKAVLALLLFSHPVSLSAQENHEGQSFSLGLIQSPKGAGLSMAFERDYIISAIAITTDFYHILNGHSVTPGARVRYNSLVPLATVGTISGKPINFFAGPGVVAGLVQDRKSDFGLIAGLNVAAGFSADIRFFTITLEFDSDLALFLTRDLHNEGVITKFYHNGIERAFYPSLRIEYKF